MRSEIPRQPISRAGIYNIVIAQAGATINFQNTGKKRPKIVIAEATLISNLVIFLENYR